MKIRPTGIILFVIICLVLMLIMCGCSPEPLPPAPPDTPAPAPVVSPTPAPTLPPEYQACVKKVAAEFNTRPTAYAEIDAAVCQCRKDSDHKFSDSCQRKIDEVE